MPTFKKHLTGLLLLSIAVIGIIASTASQKSETASNYLLPSNFNPNKQVLLIEKAGSESQVEEMKEYMSSNYPFKYEFITWDDLSADKYSDKDSFQFALRKVELHDGHTPKFDFCFYDHISNQQYSKTGDESAEPKEPLEKIIKKIVKKYK